MITSIGAFLWAVRRSSLPTRGPTRTRCISALRIILEMSVGVICCVSVPASAESPDQFQQAAQGALDALRGQAGWNAARCMIAPSVTHDIVIGMHDRVLRYGDKILQVADQPLSSSVASPVIDALRRQPPSGFVRLKILRDGAVLT